MVNVYHDGASVSNRPGAGPDLASLAGADNLDSFNMLMGCSCAFRCINTGDVPSTIPFWNGNVTSGTINTAVWTLECDPKPDDLSAIAGWTMPPIFIQVVEGATTGDFVGAITYDEATGIYTLDLNVADGGVVIEDDYEFYAIILTSFTHASHEDRVKVLGGND